jgi:hypothetical protein
VALFSDRPQPFIFEPLKFKPAPRDPNTPARNIGEPSAFNWFELYPGFEIPRNLNASQFPPYGSFNPDIPDPTDLIRLGTLLDIPSWAWAAWYSARKTQRLPNIPLEILEEIAWRKYGTARYQALVPQWRRSLVELATDIDDIEDQLSTILWLLEWISGKFIPIPPSALNFADDIRKLLDRAQDALTPISIGRAAKAEWAEKHAEARRTTRAARSKNAKIITWLQNNYGRVLEAAQATGTWFDVGVVIGPIFGFIEEGMWGLAQKTLDNYLIAAEAFMPGYTEDFKRNAQELADSVDETMTEWWEDTIDVSQESEQLWNIYY